MNGLSMRPALNTEIMITTSIAYKSYYNTLTDLKIQFDNHWSTAITERKTQTNNPIE